MKQIMLPYRFYRDVMMIAQNREGRDDAANLRNLLVEDDIIPSFQIAIPYSGVNEPAFTLKLYDLDGNETDITSLVSVVYDIAYNDGMPMLYITHMEEEVSYDTGCYRAEFTITGDSTFYSVVFQSISSNYSDTYYRQVNDNGDIRMVDATDKRVYK